MPNACCRCSLRKQPPKTEVEVEWDQCKSLQRRATVTLTTKRVPVLKEVPGIDRLNHNCCIKAGVRAEVFMLHSLAIGVNSLLLMTCASCLRCSSNAYPDDSPEAGTKV